MKKKATLLLLSALASQTETAGYLIDAVAEKNKEEVLDEKEKKLLNIGIAIVAVYAIARVVVLSAQEQYDQLLTKLGTGEAAAES